jgi:hypothetical protein
LFILLRFNTGSLTASAAEATKLPRVFPINWLFASNLLSTSTIP